MSAQQTSHDIRPMQDADLARVLSWRNHPDIARFMLQPNKISEQEHAAWYERSQAMEGRHLLIYERDGQASGFCQLNRSGAEDVADWGFYLSPEAPRGSGTMLGHCALRFGFEQAQLFKVCGQVLESNPRSQRFHLRLGFQQEGVLRGQHLIHNERQDLICYGLLRSEYENK